MSEEKKTEWEKREEKREAMEAELHAARLAELADSARHRKESERYASEFNVRTFAHQQFIEDMRREDVKRDVQRIAVFEREAEVFESIAELLRAMVRK